MNGTPHGFFCNTKNMWRAKPIPLKIGHSLLRPSNAESACTCAKKKLLPALSTAGGRIRSLQALAESQDCGGAANASFRETFIVPRLFRGNEIGHLSTIRNSRYF